MWGRFMPTSRSGTGVEFTEPLSGLAKFIAKRVDLQLLPDHHLIQRLKGGVLVCQPYFEIDQSMAQFG